MEFGLAKVLVANKLVLSVEIELSDTSLSAEDAAHKLSCMFNGSNIEYCRFIVMLLRESNTTMFDVTKLEIKKVE